MSATLRGSEVHWNRDPALPLGGTPLGGGEAMRLLGGKEGEVWVGESFTDTSGPAVQSPTRSQLPHATRTLNQRPSGQAMPASRRTTPGTPKCNKSRLPTRLLGNGDVNAISLTRLVPVLLMARPPFHSSLGPELPLTLSLIPNSKVWLLLNQGPCRLISHADSALRPRGQRSGEAPARCCREGICDEC